MREAQTLKEPLKWAGDEREGEQLLAKCHLIRGGGSEDWRRRQDAHGKDANLLMILLQTAVRTELS